MASFGRSFKRVCEAHGIPAASARLNESLANGSLNPRVDVSLRELAEAFCGPDWERYLRPGVRHFLTPVTESTDAVDPSAFAHITGQLLVNEIRQKYQAASLIGDTLTETVPITNGNLGPQRVPYQSDVLNASELIQPGMPYPKSKFTEQYLDMPAPEKYGLICQVTMEAVASDLTGQILDSAGSVGRRVGIDREERILRVVLGLVNNHSFNGTALNTYQTTTPWINDVASKTFTDFSHLNEMEQQLVQMVDPVTGKPIVVQPTGLLVMPEALYNARHIMRTTEIRTGNFATSGTPIQQTSGNVIETVYPIYASPFARQILVTATASGGGGLTADQAAAYEFLGDFKRAFIWRQFKPFYTEEAPQGNPMEFNNDVVLAVKAGTFGVAAVRDPRFVARRYNT